jgi:oxygen-independent coproporphyrinogen-3 oxidase
MIGSFLSIFRHLLFTNFVWMAGIYIHIPFCKQKCSYCDFHFSTTFGTYRKQMINALCSEIRERVCSLKEPLETLYFGGGTPSLLTSEELEQIISMIAEITSFDQLKEATLEANPDDITEETLLMWKEAGITRLSIGLQSFKESDLQWMNRAHSVEEALQCVPLAKANGFDNISVDLMYGLPDLALGEWREHIAKVISMNVSHISAYCLTVEEKTVLDRLVKQDKLSPAGEDLQSEQFEILTQALVGSGYEHYEISNFGKPGMHAIHNSNYWRGKPYIGIGPSAHSFDGLQRRWNVSNNYTYMKMHESEWFETEELSPKDHWNELLLTGLRTSWGVDQEKLFEILNPDDNFTDKLEKFIQSGWITIQADHIAAELFQ